MIRLQGCSRSAVTVNSKREIFHEKKIIFAVFASAFAIKSDAATYWLKEKSSDSGTTAFKDAAFWVDGTGNPSGESGAALDPMSDYVMQYSLRQTRGESYAKFGGASLRVNGSGACMLQYYNEGTSFEKLYLTSGYYVFNRGHNIKYNLDADIVVDSESGSEFRMTLSYTNVTANIKGSISSAEGSCLTLATVSPNYGVSNQTKYGVADDDSWHKVVMYADLSAYEGTLRLGRTTDGQFTATPENWQMKLVIPDDKTLPGTVEVPSYDVLCVNTSATFTVGNLSMAAGSMLQFEKEDSDLGSIVVTRSFSITAPVSIHIPKGLPLPSEGGRFVLLEAPDTSGNAFEASDFTLIQSLWGPSASLSVETDAANGIRRLLLVSPRWLPDGAIALKTSDTTSKDYKKTEPEQLHSALTNAAYWANNAVPDSEHDYCVLPKDTVPYADTYRALRTRSDLSTDVFPGKSLTIGKNCYLFVATDNMTFGDLRLLDGSILACPNSGSSTIKGAIDVPWGTVRLRQYCSRTLEIASTVTGNAELVLEGWSSTGSPRGYYRFRYADMSAFLGTIRITEHSSMHTPDYKNTNQTLYVHSASGEIQLGGKLPVFNPKALTIERCGTLSLNSGNLMNITTNYNRGIYINGDGRIAMQNTWHILDISTRLTVNGRLVKDGAGELVLRGKCVPEGDSPTLDVWSNNVVVASAESINGLKVQLGENTQLELRVDPEDEELMEYGIRMEKALVPFVLKDGLEKIPFVIDCSNMSRPDVPVEIGLVTVSSSAADGVAAMLPAFTSPFPRTGAQLIRRESTEDGTVTFALSVTPKGFTVVIR